MSMVFIHVCLFNDNFEKLTEQQQTEPINQPDLLTNLNRLMQFGLRVN